MCGKYSTRVVRGKIHAWTPVDFHIISNSMRGYVWKIFDACTAWKNPRVDTSGLSFYFKFYAWICVENIRRVYCVEKSTRGHQWTFILFQILCVDMCGKYSTRVLRGKIHA